MFIGNTRISAVTGEEASLDTPSLSIVGETANLRPVFDEIIVRDKITVDSETLETVINGFLTVRKDLVAESSVSAEKLILKEGNVSKQIDIVTGQPSAAQAVNNGDYGLLNNIARGENLGWYWSNSDQSWIKFGLVFWKTRQ